ncbi:ARPP-2 domain-containing protein [Streptomyces sp. NPDC090445]|uniref:ARPP-2 domain-containing protein n=1 Tax=Streptomyces sp. NPDC090445 TaxID=3365963 RepID=UPI003830FC83
MTTPDPTMLDLTGLAPRPAQVWGAVRLVPLVRDEPLHDLRLRPELYGDAAGQAEADPPPAHLSYVPHGFVATWTGDGTPAAAFGTQLSADGNSAPTATMGLRFHRRTARRQAKDRLRFLPAHLALEGYLALHFGGPTIAWEEWSQRAIRQGLSPRVEEAYAGAEVRGLADALRIFEIHPGQCGVLLYVADALAAAFAVPHPDDYRALHPTLLQDLYGELIHHYATLMPPVPDFRARIPDAQIRSLAHLRTAVAEQESAWAHFHDTTMATGLLEQAYTWQRVYRMGRFTLSRFLPLFRPKQENHIGEAITDDRGRIAFLKTFRLSEAQVRRGHLLSRLADNDWHLADTAAGLGIDKARLGLRLASAGFGYLLRQDVLDGYRRQARLRRA